MTGNARRTAVDLVLDHKRRRRHPQWHAYGTLNAVLADDVTSMLKAVLGSAVDRAPGSTGSRPPRRPHAPLRGKAPNSPA